MTKNSREKTIIGSLVALMALITVITIFAVVIFRQTAAQQEKEEIAAQAVMQAQAEDDLGPQTKSQPEPAQARAVSAPAFTFSQQVKGAQIEPGREFLTELSDEMQAAAAQLAGQVRTEEEPYEQNDEIDEERAKQEIETMVESAAELGLNTLVVSVNHAYGTLWDSGSSMTSFDALGMLYDSAHRAGIDLYALYDLSFVATEDGEMRYVQSVNAQSLDRISQQLSAFAQTGKADGILLDGYLNPETQDSYYQFTQSGENVSLDTYMTQHTQLLVESAVEAVRQSGAGIPVGLAVSPVWATEQENPQGMPIEYTQTSLGEYHADTKAMIEQGLCDFVMVKNYGAISSESIPFEQVADWWNQLLSQTQTPALMGHASSKAGTWQHGWGGNKELANQWEIADNESAFSGSIFNSLKVLLQNPNYTTYHLTNLWQSEGEAQQPQQDSLSAQLSGSYSELNDQYAGAQDLLIDMDPVGTVTVVDGDVIEVTAVAKSGADLTASINGDVVAMIEAQRASGMSGYSRYEAQYEVDQSDFGSSQNVYISVIASLNGERSSLTGARIVFNGSGSSSSSSSSSSASGSASGNSGSSYGEGTVLSYQKPSLSTSSSKKIGDGTLVQVVSEQALTFPVNKNTIYPDTKCYPLPYGTMDYVVGDKVSIKDGSKYRHYYKLASGRRVYCEDVEAVTGGVSIKQNRITDMTVKANSDFTYVILKSDYPVAYLPEYSNGKMKFEFQNTVSTPGNLTLSKNPIFSSASWSGSTLELDFLTNSSFLGYKGYHENGNIVLRFNNPTGIKGARIVVDPGHGGTDPGVADNIDPDWPEKRINWELSKEIASALEAKGAKVKLLQTYDNTTLLDSRLSQARNFDASLFLCIHTNSSETNAGASGSECYYFYPFSKNLAARMSGATSDGLSTGDRGAKYDVFYVNRDPQFISVLSEVGFLTNSSEYNKMQKDSYQKAVGKEVADAVEKYLENAGAEYAGRTGTQSTGETLNASNGPSSSAGGSSSGSVSSEEPSDNSSSQSDSKPSSKPSGSSSSSDKAPVSQTVVTDGKKDGQVKYIIFTDPENKKLNLSVGDEKKLGIRITGDSDVQRKYTTSNKNVATIDKDGVVTAVGAGSCKITVVAGDQGGSIEVRVSGGSSSKGDKVSADSGSSKQESGLESSSGYVPTSGIKIRASRNQVPAGQSIQLEVVFYPSNATGQNINWSITRGKLYGSVDGRGVFTGIESGFATVKATTEDGAYSATYRMEIM